MTPKRWRRIEELYHSARERDPERRGAFLAEACKDDEELRRRIELLLAQDSSGDKILDHPAADLLESPTKTKLIPGTELGPYRIEGTLGTGGMGEVYRARDPRMGRDVAVKVSNERFSDRFSREVHAVAALNHPNICHLYDVGPDYLVMELVEGPTLAERIKQGSVPLEEALAIARQIAEALESAHDKGIVHRDLKPSNIKLTAAGAVKVLDFGLAKTLEPATGSPKDSPTMTATQEGMILGTAAYMSPEQALGKPVDKRADIWAFGLVLWELLTGHRLFEGDSVTHILAGVLNSQIAFEQLPRETPAAIRGLLRRCLDRDTKNRLRDVGEARIAIDAAFQPIEPAALPAQPRSLFAWIAPAVVLALSLGALAFVHFRETPPQRQRFKFQINPEGGRQTGFQLSPDGRFLGYATVTITTGVRVWHRSLASLDTRLVIDRPGLSVFFAFWSPDGESVAFQSADKLYKLARNGGSPIFLADVPQQVLGGVWFDNGVILLGTESGLFRVSSSGGAAVKIGDQQALLSWLPGRRFLSMGAKGTFAGSLDGGKPTLIMPDPVSDYYVQPVYVPPSKPGLPGHLLFIRNGTLWAQSFYADKLELQGEAIAVEARVSAFSASTNGVLVFQPATSPDVVLTWLDRAGKRLRTVSRPFRPDSVPVIRLSPNDSQAIVQIDSGDGKPDLWIADLNSNALSRFTFNGSRSGIWSPDGRKVLLAANDGNRYVRSADGSGEDELLFKDQCGDCCCVTAWSSDGRFITFNEYGGIRPHGMWIVPTQGTRKPIPYRQSQFATYWNQISPDSRWLAYGTNQQIFVESVPTGKGRWQISTESGDWPIWRRDGKELFYIQGTKLMAVPIRLTQKSVESGKPEALFDLPVGTRFQVSRDGQRFLIALPVESASPSPPLTVDSDWRAGFGK